MEIKAGTRCECRVWQHGHVLAREGETAEHCHLDAVRMVTVRESFNEHFERTGCTYSKADESREYQFPMCASCADWHEKGKPSGSIHCDCGKPKSRDAAWGRRVRGD